MTDNRTDPVHKDLNGKWYFYDETWDDRQGPYDTEHEARMGLAAYMTWLDIGETKHS